MATTSCPARKSGRGRQIRSPRQAHAGLRRVGAINRIGHEPGPGDGLEFWGASFVADPSGVVLKRGSHDKEENLVVRCDLGRIEETRRNWPFLRDRRIDAYGNLTKRWDS